MNDMAEFRFAASVFRGHLDRRFAVERPGAFLEVLAAMRRHMDQGLNLSNVYSVSFSSNGDEESMWRLYADRGAGFSFCIPFSHGLERWTKNYPWGWICKCHYGEQPLAEFCNTALVKAEELFAKERNSSDPSTAEEFAQEFLNRIASFGPAFKPQIWANENEWRWVFVISPEDKRPFLELPLQSQTSLDQLAISSICQGPECEIAHIRNLQKLLSASNYKSCKVYSSIHPAAN
jgi:hypothetical protein